MLFFSFSTFPIRYQNIYCSSTLSFINLIKSLQELRDTVLNNEKTSDSDVCLRNGPFGLQS